MIWCQDSEHAREGRGLPEASLPSVLGLSSVSPPTCWGRVQRKPLHEPAQGSFIRHRDCVRDCIKQMVCLLSISSCDWEAPKMPDPDLSAEERIVFHLCHSGCAVEIILHWTCVAYRLYETGVVGSNFPCLGIAKLLSHWCICHGQSIGKGRPASWVPVTGLEWDMADEAPLRNCTPLKVAFGFRQRVFWLSGCFSIFPSGVPIIFACSPMSGLWEVRSHEVWSRESVCKIGDGRGPTRTTFSVCR